MAGKKKKDTKEVAKITPGELERASKSIKTEGADGKKLSSAQRRLLRQVTLAQALQKM